MSERFRRVARGEIGEAALAGLTPPARLRLQIVTGDRAKQQMLTIEVILHRVLFVEDLEILYTGGNGVILIFDAYGEGVRFGVPAIVAAEQLVVEASGRIDS